MIHGNGETQDMRIMGALRKLLPFTAVGFGIAWLSIAGIPPFAGFWAKDEILAAAYFNHSYGVWALGLLAAALTGFYMTRETLLVFDGNERFRMADEGDDHAPAEHDVTASPTVDYGTAVAPAHLHHDPHEDQGPWCSRSWCWPRWQRSAAC